MEDGSAVPLEIILVQSGPLGFYQKRLFICTCFLQALTVSALVYASHCRPDLSPPTPATATNGALPQRPRCTRVVIPTNVSESPTLALGHRDTPNLETTLNQSANVSSVSGLHSAILRGIPAWNESSLSESSLNLSALNVSSLNDTSFNLSERKPGRDVPLEGSNKFMTSVKYEQEEKVNLQESLFLLTTSGTVRQKVLLKESIEDLTSPFSEAKDHGRLNETGSNVNSVDGVQTTNSEGLSHSQTLPQFKEISRRKALVSTSYPVSDMSLISTSSDHVTGNIVHWHDEKKVWSTITEVVSSNALLSDNSTVCQFEDEEEGPLFFTLTYLSTPDWLGDMDKQTLIQLNTYCQAVGVMLGAALGAWGADLVGRRRPLFLYFPLMLLAHAMSGFAVSWSMLAAFRFLVGLFAGACAVVSLVFPMEFIGHEYRDMCVCSGIWIIGVLVISFELLVTKHWRYLAFLSAGVGIPLIGTYFIASESARWLLCHQRFPEAEATLKELISCNSASVSDFLTFFDKSRACVVTNMHTKRYTFLDLFHSLEMTKWTLALIYTCLVASSVYFCLLSKVKDMTGNLYVDTSLPFFIDLPLGWSAVVVNRCLGRRWCLFLYAVASGLALLSVLVLHMTGNLSQIPSMLTGMAVFGKIGVTASLGLVFIIAVEMYPTVVRCLGVAVGVMAVSGGSLIAETYVFLEAYHYTVPFVVFGVMMASVGFAGLLFPETLHRPLPNILPCRHRTIPLHEGVRLVTNPWDVL